MEVTRKEFEVALAPFMGQIEGLKLARVLTDAKGARMRLVFESKTWLEDDMIKRLRQAMAQCFIGMEVSVRLVYPGLKDAFLQNPKPYIDKMITYLARKYPGCMAFFRDAVWTYQQADMRVRPKQMFGVSYLRESGVIAELQKMVERAFGVVIHIKVDEPKLDTSSIESFLQRREEADKEILQSVRVVEEKPEKEKSTRKKNVVGRMIAQEVVPIGDLRDDSGLVAVQGEVVKSESRPLKGGTMVLVTFHVADDTGTIACKLFLRARRRPGAEGGPEGPDPEQVSAVENAVAKRRWVRVCGECTQDRFLNDISLSVRDLNEWESCEILRADKAEKKRIELHAHTQMSSLDAVLSASDLIKRAAEWGHEAIAITDHGVLQAFPEAFGAAKKNGIRLIPGVEGYLAENAETKGSYHIILLVKDQDGMTDLNRLVSVAHLEHFYRRPRMLREMIEKYREHLIIGSACEAGELYQAVLEGKSDAELDAVASFYDYLEIQPVGNNAFMVRNGKVANDDALRDINRKIIEIGDRCGLPVVATCDVHFLNPKDEEYRRVLMGAQGFSDSDEQPPLYFRTTEEMLAEFSYLGERAHEVVVDNPAKILSWTTPVTLFPKHPTGAETFQPFWPEAADQTRNLAMETAKSLYGDPLPEIVEARLEHELKSIIGNGFATLYRIAHLLVKKSNEDGYLVGSRGSVGSSFVATMTGITEVNPLPPHYRCPDCKYNTFEVDNQTYSVGPDLPKAKCPKCGATLRGEGFDIPFEVFLGFYGDKVPDIDLNFSGEYQPRAHAYVEELFGEGYVFRAGTIGALAEKTAFGYARKYLEERGVQTTVAEVERLAEGCVGVRRTTGQHPGGIVVLPKDYEIYQFTAVQHPADKSEGNIITTHFDFSSMHDILVKLDILGHDDPTMIRELEMLTGVKALDVPLVDEKVMALFLTPEPLGLDAKTLGSSTGTLGIPEFGTKFVRGMLEDTMPKCLADLIRISGLSHGTDVWLGNAQMLIETKTATFAECICTRDDIMNALIARGVETKMAFDTMESVRKGKGLKPEMESAMRAADTPEWFIDSCKKIKYMFPKGHAVAYVTMALRIAYFKVYYPLAYYAAYYTVRADDFDASIMAQGIEKAKKALWSMQSNANAGAISDKDERVVTILEIVIEMYLRGFDFSPIDLYQSDARHFEIVDGRIRPPLNALPGLGDAAAESLVQARAHGTFRSVEDIVTKSKVSKTVVGLLREAGCLGDLPDTDQISFFDALG